MPLQDRSVQLPNAGCQCNWSKFAGLINRAEDEDNLRFLITRRSSSAVISPSWEGEVGEGRLTFRLACQMTCLHWRCLYVVLKKVSTASPVNEGCTLVWLSSSRRLLVNFQKLLWQAHRSHWLLLYFSLGFSSWACLLYRCTRRLVCATHIFWFATVSSQGPELFLGLLFLLLHYL